MPAGEKGVTIEAMTKDASIEDGGSGILGTVMVIGAAAVLTWQGCRIGTELYLKRILPDGAAIPANATELAELVWDDAGKPAPAAALDNDAHRRHSPGPLRTSCFLPIKLQMLL